MVVRGIESGKDIGFNLIVVAHMMSSERSKEYWGGGGMGEWAKRNKNLFSLDNRLGAIIEMPFTYVPLLDILHVKINGEDDNIKENIDQGGGGKNSEG